jgi:hypothetical protein
MIQIACETQIAEIGRISSIPAIEAMNQYMLSLANDFPIQSLVKKNTIKKISEIDPIFVIHSPQNIKYECISGIRALNTFNEYGITSCMVIAVEEISISETIQLAIRNNILPLVYWPVAFSGNVRCFKFINELRKCLPKEYKELIPSPASLKHKMGIGNFQGRKNSYKKSALDILLESLDERD